MSQTTKTITLVRGLPGSGKTRKAHELRGIAGTMHASDDYFTDEKGVYTFDYERLPESHQQCLAFVGQDILDGIRDIIVHNTFTRAWEMQSYFRLAVAHGYRISIVDLFDAGLTDLELFERGTHGVPLEIIEKMRGHYEQVTEPA